MRTTREGVQGGGVAVLRSPVATVSRRVYSDRQSFFLQGLAAWGTSGVWAEEEFPAEPCPCLPDETPQECALRCGQENRRCNTFGCTTPACYRTGYRRCNTTGNECRQMTNPPLCGGCTCREHEPDPCICEL